MSDIHHVGVHEAKTHLSRLLRAVEAGDEVVLTRGGQAVARIVAEPAPRAVADTFGMFAGQFTLAADFDADSDQLADLFGIPPAPGAA